LLIYLILDTLYDFKYGFKYNYTTLNKYLID